MSGYALIQAAGLILLRKIYLLTVYQTALTYLAVSLAGILLVFLAATVWKENGFGYPLRDIWLLLWSSFHGVIILGFLTCGTYYLTLTQLNIIQAVNIFLGMAVYWIAYLFLRSCAAATAAGNIVVGLLGILNHYLVIFRGAAFRVSDFGAARTAGNVARNYDFTPDVYIFAAVVDLTIWCILIRAVCGGVKRKKFWNRWNIVVTAAVAGGCILLPLTHFDRVYAQTGQFSKDTYLADLLVDFMGNAEALPKDYSVEAVDVLIQEVWKDRRENVVLEEPVPNIVVIMNEAFSDLRVLGDFETDVPVLPFWDSLQSNVIRGWANVSVLGGSTANSEYEFLTSDSAGAFAGASPIPYNSYFTDAEGYPGLVSVLEEQGYGTVAFHPYLSSGWNRMQVYHAMGFDDIIFSEDLPEEPETLRLYVSDKGDYSYVEDWFEEKEAGVPLFFFNVTMQNHGGYTYGGDDFESTVHLTGDAAGRFPQTEQYLSLIKASDEALSGLFSYFEEYAEPVILVLFGDHQPKLETGFYEYVSGSPYDRWDLEQRSRQYKTPFIIWSNYALPEDYVELGDVSLNYLGPLLLQRAGLELSGYQRYMLEEYEKLPVYTGQVMQDAEGRLYAAGSEEYRNRTSGSRFLAYNHTVDVKNRREAFFSVGQNAGD